MLTVGAGVRCRYLRICYQHEHDDTLRISLDRDFTMVDEPAMGRSGTGWRWNDDIFAAQGKARHVFPYLLRKNHAVAHSLITHDLLQRLSCLALSMLTHSTILCTQIFGAGAQTTGRSDDASVVQRAIARRARDRYAQIFEIPSRRLHAQAATWQRNPVLADAKSVRPARHPRRCCCCCWCRCRTTADDANTVEATTTAHDGVAISCPRGASGCATFPAAIAT